MIDLYSDRFSSGDYKAAFIEDVNELLNDVQLPVRWRNKAADDLIESYVIQTDERPDAMQLSRLADYILRDDLSDPHPDKVSNTEFPILSQGQIKLRHGREYAGGDVSHYSSDVKHKLNGTRKKTKGELAAW